jgi:hypothetical protein
MALEQATEQHQHPVMTACVGDLLVSIFAGIVLIF